MKLRIISDQQHTIIADADTGTILRGARVIRIEMRDGRPRAIVALDDVQLDLTAEYRKRKPHQIRDILRLVMAKNHLTLAEIGHAVGVSESTVCRWANGKARPSKERAACLADYLATVQGDA